jgi:acid phosphatase type 7
MNITRRDALCRIATMAAAPIVTACGVDRLLSPDPGLGRLDGPGLALGRLDGGLTLIGAGDPQGGGLRGQTARMVKAVLDADPSAVAFCAGDLVASGTRAEFRDTYGPTWGTFLGRTWTTLGNHDDIADPTATPYWDYVGARGGPRGKGWYAVNLNGYWRLYVLNSEVATNAEQLAWLTNDVRKWPKHRKIGMWHVPNMASICQMSPTKAMTWPTPIGKWWDLLQANGGEFVICGHAHRYERFAQCTKSGVVSANGMREFITGAGGLKPMPILKVHPRSQRQVVECGVTQFELYPDRYEWTFRNTNGLVRDSGTQLCKKATTTV